jgi:O-antigen ligase
MIRDEPIFGVGAGAFKVYVDRYEPLRESAEPLDARPNLSAHNVPLEIWTGSGTPTLLLYLALLAVVFRRLHSRRSGGEPLLFTGLAAALLGLFVTSAFHNYQYDNLLWAVCGVAASLAVWETRTVESRTLSST